MASDKDVMLGEAKTWMCLICARSYRYKGALDNHVKKEHPEVWGVTLEEFERVAPSEPAIRELPKSIAKEVSEIKLEPVAESVFVPTVLQEKFPFAEKWVNLSKKDRSKIEIAVGKVRPIASLGDILNFRIEGDLITLVLADGRKCNVDIVQP